MPLCDISLSSMPLILASQVYMSLCDISLFSMSLYNVSLSSTSLCDINPLSIPLCNISLWNTPLCKIFHSTLSAVFSSSIYNCSSYSNHGWCNLLQGVHNSTIGTQVIIHCQEPVGDKANWRALETRKPLIQLACWNCMKGTAMFEYNMLRVLVKF